MKRHDMIMHMRPRELGGLLDSVANTPVCLPFTGNPADCRKYLSCAGCYYKWLNDDVSDHWCTNCKHYEKWGKCLHAGGEHYNEVKDYNDTCGEWEPAEWWEESPPKKTCRTCQHRDDYLGVCVCGDGEYGEDFNDDGNGCRAWEARK